MGVIRVEKTSNYTVMSNYHLRDKSLTLKAKGLMSLMLSLPDDWDYSIAGLVSIVAEGETAVRNALNELIEHKYLTREKVYTNGKISDWNYTLYEMPTDVRLPVENLTLENLTLDNQVVENLAQLNTDNNQIKKDKIKNDKSTVAGASLKHPRNFSKETLTDDLQSGKEIDTVKKEIKKESKYDKCSAEIEKREFTDFEKSLLKDFLYWSFNTTDPNRNNEPKRFAKRLDELLKLKGDRTSIIKQSRERKWHCFYEMKPSVSAYTNHSDSKIQSQTLSQEEAAEVLKGYAERNGVV